MAAGKDLADKTEAKNAAQTTAANAETAYQTALTNQRAKRAAWLEVAHLVTDTASEWLGQTMIVTGYGFLPDEMVTLELHSNVFQLSQTQADHTGAIRQEVTIPLEATVGDHLIVATGQTSGLTLSTSVDLMKRVATNKQPKRTVSGLPPTGAFGELAGDAWVVVPLALMVAGAAARARRKA